ncbi:putative tydmidine kinase [Brevibacillus phage SecTim467]|uniref:Thymidine kinase n=2 Tax=Jenstvirus jenst TaxID=1982225 RepID=A0A0K2CPH9_9CAUD|nr:thymidine kinase [Brevibacillus phage Jenst]ALA07150.1 putative thymidine kinase [Brevibacillus phage Jenst]ALA07520.1 putative tydmidine kinase [Brevibacillus phage SecTim467]
MENAGRLIAYVGAMGSGKTKKLIELYEEMKADGMRVAIFKPFISRGGEDDEFVYARNGKKAPAITIECLYEIPAIVDKEQLQSVLIDEIQFFEAEDSEKMLEVTDVLEALAMAGLEVYVYGLDVDSDNMTFGNIGNILAHADEVHKLQTYCVKCGEEARVSKYMKGMKDSVIQTGDLGDYQPHCRSCYYDWEDRLKEIENTATISLDGGNFHFSIQVSREKLDELGLNTGSISDKLQTVDDVLKLLAIISKEELE